MANDQGIELAPQWVNLTLSDVQFKTNNVVGNFEYPSNIPAYKPIMKFLFNCPLKIAFTSTPTFSTETTSGSFGVLLWHLTRHPPLMQTTKDSSGNLASAFQS